MTDVLTTDTYQVDLAAVDITPYKTGNIGVDYVTTFDSGAPGPHVMVMAVTHGNELCGAIALDWLFKQEVRPLRGKLTLGFSNWRAYETFDAANPLASRYVDEDLNRVWGEDVLDGERNTWETTRARELRPVIDDIDLLLDIHSMTTTCAPLMLSGPLEKGRDLARRVGVPAYVVCDEGHAAGKRMRDYGGFGDPASDKNALLVECGQHWEQLAEDMAMDTMLRFLGVCGSVDEAFVTAHLRDAALPAQTVIEVSHPYTIQGDRPVRWAEDYIGFEVIAKAGTVLGWDGDLEVTAPHDDCVLIMPNKVKAAPHSAVRFGRLMG